MFHRIPLTLLLTVAFSFGCTTKPIPQAPVTATVMVPVATASATPEATGYHCDGAPFHIADQDYCAYDTPATWREASRACNAISARLMSFSSAPNANAIRSALGPTIEISAEAFWIGLREPEEEERKWAWIDGKTATYTHWNKGEPNDANENEDCAEWKLGSGSWNDAPCWSDRKYICQQQGTKPLTCDGTRLHGSAGDFCFSSEAFDWERAKQNCTEQGGVLAILSNKESDEALHKAIGPKLGMPSVWIGYNDMAQEGNWRWLSGSRYVSSDWKLGEPNDFQDDEDCAEWFPEDGLMNDLYCSTKRPYICERISH